MVKEQLVQCCKLPDVLVLALVVQMLALVMDLCCQMLHTGLRICLLILLELLVEEEEEEGRLDIPGLVLLALE